MFNSEFRYLRCIHEFDEILHFKENLLWIWDKENIKIFLKSSSENKYIHNAIGNHDRKINNCFIGETDPN